MATGKLRRINKDISHRDISLYMEEVVFPRWIRFLDIFVGVVSIAAAVLIVLESALAHFVLIVTMCAAMIAIGLARVARAASVKAKGVPRRLTNLLIGIAVIALSGGVILEVGVSEVLAVQMIALGWILLGLARIIIGILEGDVQLSLRVVQFIVGMLSIGVAVWVLLFPSTEFTTEILFLSIIVGLNGIARLTRGHVGV
jgi:uncharacterized membrane protein HdeD (DUF308 family)